MKKTISILIILSSYYYVNATTELRTSMKNEVITQAKIDIKIKNDTDETVLVYNAGSGGTYSLTKGAITTIKMEKGDKLYISEKGKKGKLILEASPEMNGKIKKLSEL